jgi:THO complex subunit 1
LGDKSSVNLRGEYHTENVTAFDDAENPASSVNAMDVDAPEGGEPSLATRSTAPASHDGPSEHEPENSSQQQEVLNMNTLYPLFWGLQTYFSAPTRLFDAENFSSFKRGLDATLANFRHISSHIDLRGASKAVEESRRGLKRKRNGDTADITNSFNPKYLTSRDLFELEVEPELPRRHIAFSSFAG